MFRQAELEHFIRQGEKTLSPVFTGRDAILEDLLEVASESWEIANHQLPGATRILQGAPGAGKSAILATLQARALSSSRTPSPRVLILGSGTITGPADILFPLARLVNPEAAPAFLARCSRTRTLEGSARLMGTGAAGRIETTRTHAGPESTLAAFRDWARELPPGAGITAPLIIAIDEAQRFGRDPEDPLAKLFRSLHDSNVALPLTLVLAGLSETADRAAAMGLTRGLTRHPVGALPERDVAALMPAWCVHFGLDPRGHDERLLRLAAPCEGWPRHLHFALQALGRAALGAEGDPARVDWAEIEDEAAASRIRYYQDQQSPAMRESVALVAAVLRELAPGARRADVIDGIDRHAGARPGRGRCLPRAMDAEEMTDHLIHQGALQEMPDGTITTPIPSFQTHLVAAGRPGGGAGSGEVL